jgi:hypothetical protein
MEPTCVPVFRTFRIPGTSPYVWGAVAAVSTVFVGVQDGWNWMTALWAVEVVLFGLLHLPELTRWVMDRINPNGIVNVMVVCAVVIGAPLGAVMGTLLPLVYQTNFSSHVAGRIGLFVGPCVAAFYGFTSVTIVLALVGIVWLFTRVTTWLVALVSNRSRQHCGRGDF